MKHNTRPIQFTLVVDNFGVKYTLHNDANNLIDTLKKHYDVSVDDTCHEYVKINLDWNYEKGKVHLFMASFHHKACKPFESSTLTILQDSQPLQMPSKNWHPCTNDTH